MMRKVGLIVMGFLIANVSFGQTIQIQGGTSFSQLEWKYKDHFVEPMYDEILIGYSFFAGLDYFEKKFYNLSSKIGLVRKGGKGKTPLYDPMEGFTGEYITDKPILDYLSINTTIELKYPLKKTSYPFICLGPRFDYLIFRSEHFKGSEDINRFNNYSIGLKLGGGIKYDLSNIQLGLQADYYLDFTKIAEWPIEQNNLGGEIKVKTFTINLSIGYKL